jgi:hypothetical protein
MAPEQALGKTASVDHRGDQYALAVIAFEMLSGQTPFSGTDLMEVLQKVVATEAPPVERFASHVPPAASAVLARGLEKNPEARFSTVLDFAAALSSACEASLPPPSAQSPNSAVLGVARTLPAAGNSAVEQASSPAIHPGERQQTGPRRRSPSLRFANASTLPGTAQLQDIPAGLVRARQALGLGDLDLALAYAESALRTAASFDTDEAQRWVDSEATLIDHIFETRIGSMQQRVNVVGVPSNLDAKVSPEQAFLISRLDGGVTVEEVLDLSPMHRRDTLRLLLALQRDGLVALEDHRPSEKHRPE